LRNVLSTFWNRDIVSAERSAQLQGLPQSRPAGREALLLKAGRSASLCAKCLRRAPKQRMAGEWIEPVNEILRITEGMMSLWVITRLEIEFIAREGGLDGFCSPAVPVPRRRSSPRTPRAPSALRQSSLWSVLYDNPHRAAAVGVRWLFAATGAIVAAFAPAKHASARNIA